MQKKAIKGFSLQYTDGSRVFNRHGNHIPQGIDGRYHLLNDSGVAEYVSKEFAISGGIDGSADGRPKAGKTAKKKSKKASS